MDMKGSVGNSMKILFLSQRFLLPMDTGGKIRTGNTLKELNKYHEITLISNVESPRDDYYLPRINEFCTHFIPVSWKEPKRYSMLFYFYVFLKLFSFYPVTVLNDYSKSLRDTVADVCRKNKYDVAICDFVQSALNFRKINDVPTILFQHNVESLISKRHIEHAGNILSKTFWWLQWKKMFAFESKNCKLFDRVISVSEKDKDSFKRLYGLDNVETIPTGVDVDYYSPMPEVQLEPNSLVFCGSMDWLPNEDAIISFIKEILPRVKNAVPNIKLTVVGRNPSPNLQRMISNNPNVELTGWVKDVRSYISKSTLYIVPIRIGGGTRLKIYEAMSMRKVVVSTSIGAEGLPVVNDKNIVIADDPIKFGDKIIELLKDREKRAKIEANAADFVRKNFAWQKVAEKFSMICSDTVEKRKK